MGQRFTALFSYSNNTSNEVIVRHVVSSPKHVEIIPWEPICEDSDLVSDLLIPDIMAVICEYLPLKDFWILARIKPFRAILKQTALPYTIMIHKPNYTLLHRFCFRRLFFAPFSCNQIDKALVKAMECNQLQEIELPCISMHALSTQNFWIYAKKSTRLKKLFFGKNDLNEKSALDELIDLASSNPHLKQIWLRLDLKWLEYLYQQVQNKVLFATFYVSAWDNWKSSLQHDNIIILNEWIVKQVEVPVIQNSLLRIRSDTKFSLEIGHASNINLKQLCIVLNTTCNYIHILDLTNYAYTDDVDFIPVEFVLRNTMHLRTLILGKRVFGNRKFAHNVLNLLIELDSISTLQTSADIELDSLELLNKYLGTSKALSKLILYSENLEYGLTGLLDKCTSALSIRKIVLHCIHPAERIEKLKSQLPKSIEFELQSL